MIAKTILNAKTVGALVEASVAEHGEEAATKVETYFRDLLGPEAAVPDFNLLLNQVGTALEVMRLGLEGAARAYLDEALDDRKLRRQRDHAAARLLRRLSAMRDVLDRTYGEGTGEELLGIGFNLSRSPKAIRELAEHAVANLAKDELRFPTAVMDGVSLDVLDLMRQLQEPLDELIEATVQLDHEKTKLDAALAARQAAQASFGETFPAFVTLIQAIYRVAGMKTLAERIRPKGRRRAAPAEAEPPVEDAPTEVLSLVPIAKPATTVVVAKT